MNDQFFGLPGRKPKHFPVIHAHGLIAQDCSILHQIHDLRCAAIRQPDRSAPGPGRDIPRMHGIAKEEMNNGAVGVSFEESCEAKFRRESARSPEVFAACWP